jgi:Lrp/AsnC family transcriptional regulator
MSVNLSSQELQILAILQKDATLSVAEIAELVGMSVSPCWRRIQHLQKTGVIESRVAILNPVKVGLHVVVYAQVKLSDHKRSTIAQFAKTINTYPEVLESYLLIGDVDCVLKIMTKDMEAYQQFYFDKLSPLPMIREVTSMMALSPLKLCSQIPLQQLSAH